jgi:hypothetical protein
MIPTGGGVFSGKGSGVVEVTVIILFPVIVIAVFFWVEISHGLIAHNPLLPPNLLLPSLNTRNRNIQRVVRDHRPPGGRITGRKYTSGIEVGLVTFELSIKCQMQHSGALLLSFILLLVREWLATSQ